MKNRLLLACVALLLCLSGCAKPAQTAPVPCDTLVTAIEQGQTFEELTRLSQAQAVKFLDIDEADVTDLLLAMDASRVTTEMILALTAKDDAALKRVKGQVEGFLASIKEEYSTYNPDETPKLEAAVLKTQGLQLVLVVSKDDKLASSALDAAWKAK